MSDPFFWLKELDFAQRALKPLGDLQRLTDPYADFAHYLQIIERSDNWKAVFKAIFGRAEDIGESFRRLYPIRIATMHARIVTSDDELLLRVETTRILKAIRFHN